MQIDYIKTDVLVRRAAAVSVSQPHRAVQGAHSQGQGERPTVVITPMYVTLTNVTMSLEITHPAPANVRDRASALRQASGVGVHEPFDVDSFVRRLGWDVSAAQLLDSTGEGTQATIQPSSRCGFTIRVDDRPAANELWELALLGNSAQKAIRRFRIAHELGHTAYYRPPDHEHDRPWRKVPVTAEEERRCDSFAAELLAPGERCVGAVRQGAASVLRLAVDLKVPVGLVLRTASEADARALVGITVPTSDGLECEVHGAWGLPSSFLAWRIWPEARELLQDAVAVDGGNPAAYLIVQQLGGSPSIATVLN